MPVDSAFTLTANDIYATLANMIISQEVFADNFGKHQTLVDKARVDGSMYGDRKLYYSVDALQTHEWNKDSEAGNLLSLDRPIDPKVQAIVLNKFRQIRLTVDNYLTKRAWSSEGAFSAFNSVMLGQMRETKRIYDGTLYNVYIGNTVATGAGQSMSITLSGTNDGQVIAKEVADLLVEMGDYSRDFNDYGYIRSYAPEAIKVIWSSKFVNKIRKVDTPTIFHAQGLVDKLDEEVMPAKYFGRAIVTSTDLDSSTSKAASGVVIRALKEMVVGSGSSAKHYFPGEKFDAGTTFGASKDVAVADAYVEDAKAICKVVVKLPPFMSAFEVGTSFFNPRSLTENHYLTFGHNSIEYLKNYPFITIKQA